MYFVYRWRLAMHLNATSSLNTFFFSPSCFPQNKTEKKILKIDLIMVCGTLYLNLNSIKREYRQSVSQSINRFSSVWIQFHILSKQKWNSLFLFAVKHHNQSRDFLKFQFSKTFLLFLAHIIFIYQMSGIFFFLKDFSTILCRALPDIYLKHRMKQLKFSFWTV